jgi:flagellar hook-length control protein FliK
MDAILPILSQTTGANGAGQSSAPDAADAGAFDALLAGHTIPVTPVPAIPSRPGGAFASAMANPSATRSATATGTSATAATAASNLPVSPTTGAPLQGNGVPQPDIAIPAAAGATGPETPGTASPSLVTGAQPNATPNPTANTAQSGSAPAGANATPKYVRGQNTEMTLDAKVSASAPIKNNVTFAPNAAGNSGETTGATTGADAVKMTAETPQPASSAVAGATAQASDGLATSVAVSTTPQAGVQARREAAGSEKAPIAGNGKPTASATASSPNASTSTPTQMAKPDLTTPAQTPTPPTAQSTAEPPLDPARLVMADQARTPPPPIDGGQADASADVERMDMSNLRGAENARGAERPGLAAGMARFTPAHAGTLAAQIAAKFQNGDRKFEIRMDPPELGRIQVKMHVGNDNRVQAILSAERPETLNDLRQHARELERALEESGLQLDNDGLSFELSQGSDQDDQTPRNLTGFTNIEFAEDLDGPITAAALPRELYGFQLSAVSRVDVRL